MSRATTAEELCAWTGGEILRGGAQDRFTGTGIDSREVGEHDLFVAIVGPNHDGHAFVGDVLAKGVAGALVQSDRLEETLPRSDGFLVHVADTTRALADLARGHRRTFDGPVIGITGSNGKTTTKELCADILRGCGPTLATRGNLNNQYGVPLTLLRREDEHVRCIVEMGMNHRGEIAALAEIAEPTIGVLTNVGTAHIEFLGSREAIAEEKGDLLAALPESGVAVVGRDQPLAFAQSERTRARVMSFGRDASADLRASDVRFLEEGAFAFVLDTPMGRAELCVPGLAETIVENALAASGGALAAGASLDDVVRGLARHQGVPGRMQPRSLPGDVRVIDDSYNANPQSMQNALETLARLATSGRRFAVLGQMGELGDEAPEAHHELGRLAGRLSLDGLYLMGPWAGEVARGAREAGLDDDAIFSTEDHESLAKRLAETVAKGDRVLFKGSRAARMERVIELLEEGAH